MAMLPVFIIGFIVGIALGYAFFMYKKDVPSTIKISTQEAEIARLKNDIELLKDTNRKLSEDYNKINALFMKSTKKN